MGQALFLYPRDKAVKFLYFEHKYHLLLPTYAECAEASTLPSTSDTQSTHLKSIIMLIESALFLNCTVIHHSGQPLSGMRISLASVHGCPTHFEGVTDESGQIWLWSPSAHLHFGPFGVSATDGSDWQVTFHTSSSPYSFPTFSVDVELYPGADRSILLQIGPNGYVVRHGSTTVCQLLLPLVAVQVPGPLPRPLPSPTSWFESDSDDDNDYAGSEDDDVSYFSLDPKEMPLLSSRSSQRSSQSSTNQTIVAAPKRKEQHDTKEAEGGDHKRQRISIQGLLE